MDFEEWYARKYKGNDPAFKMHIETAWDAALELAAKEVNKIAMHSNTIVCAVDVINRNRTDT